MLLYLPRRRPSALQSAIDMYGAAMGNMFQVGKPNGYETHKARWIETGDPVELTRMCRHIVFRYGESRFT